MAYLHVQWKSLGWGLLEGIMTAFGCSCGIVQSFGEEIPLRLQCATEAGEGGSASAAGAKHLREEENPFPFSLATCRISFTPSS